MQVINRQVIKSRFLTTVKYGLIVKAWRHGKHFKNNQNWRYVLHHLWFRSGNSLEHAYHKWYHQISQECRGSRLLQNKIHDWHHNGTTVEENMSFFTDHQEPMYYYICWVDPALQISSEASRWTLSRTVLLQQMMLISPRNTWTWCSIFKGQVCQSIPSSSCEWCHRNPKRTDCKSIKCLWIDTMFVNSLALLTTVSMAIKFRTCDCIPTTKVVK